MSVGYKAVQWSRTKIIYDSILLVTVAIYLYGFMTITAMIDPDLDLHGVRTRAYGSAAFLLLHVILSIGPLSRLSSTLHPLLRHRRHMGVVMFLLSIVHINGWRWLNLPWIWFGTDAPDWPIDFNGALTWHRNFGTLDPLVSLFMGNSRYGDVILFPFETLGALALIILFLMAATSHDFWLVNLTAPIWKTLHMAVYAAYGLLVGHVVLGALQINRDPVLTGAVLVGMVWIVTLHLITGTRERYKDHKDRSNLLPRLDGFVDIGAITDFPDDRAKVVMIAGERVAVFKYNGNVSAISNVCQHQNGPLGEGTILDGCVTCPWHGHQYQIESGASPPPFDEKVPTFDVKVEGGHIFVHATPHPPGTPVIPAQV